MLDCGGCAYIKQTYLYIKFCSPPISIGSNINDNSNKKVLKFVIMMQFIIKLFIINTVNGMYALEIMTK